MTERKNRIKKPVIRVNGHTYYHSDVDRSARNGRKPYISPDGQLMNEVAAAEYVGKSVSTHQNRRSKKQEPKSFKVGRSVLYRKSDLDKFLEPQ